MNTNTQNTSNTSRKSLIVIFILFLLSSAGVFGQTTTTVVPQPTTPIVEVVTTSNAIIALDSNVDFMNWFMGSKQTQTIKEQEAAKVSVKKQFIQSGITPNKVLYRTFVKRVLSQESAIV